MRFIDIKLFKLKFVAIFGDFKNYKRMAWLFIIGFLLIATVVSAIAYPSSHDGDHSQWYN